MSQVWSVMINGSVPATFTPDVYGCGDGEAVKAQPGDLVCWNNQTNDPHQIEVYKPGGVATFTTDVIEKSKSSSPGYSHSAPIQDDERPPAAGTPEASSRPLKR
jgi:hypothetical protein